VGLGLAAQPRYLKMEGRGCFQAVSVLVLVMVASCSATGQLATNSPVTSSFAEATPTETPTEAPPTTYRPGEASLVKVAGVDYAKVTISKPSFVAAYKGQLGTDRPKTPGDVFLQAWVTYQALAADGIDYNFNDWATYADGANVTDLAFIINGPQPIFKSGHLPNGRTVSFWLVNEVPAKGEVLLSYAPPQFVAGGNPIAEWKVR
jgi:hypothetical protein